MQPRAMISIILFALASLLWSTHGQAATYYTDQHSLGGSCNNANAGTQSQPVCSLDAGVAKLFPGDTLFIRGGSYDPGLIGSNAGVMIRDGASESQRITVSAYPGETVILTGYNAGVNLNGAGNFLTFNGLIIDLGESVEKAGLFVYNVHHVTFQNGEIRGGWNGQLIFGGGSNHIIRNNKLHGMRDRGLLIQGESCYAMYFGPDNSLIEGNAIFNNAGYAIHLYSSGASYITDNVIRNNVIWGNGHDSCNYQSSSNIIVSSGARNQFYNNLVYNNSTGIAIDYRCHDCIVSNNTFYNNVSYTGAGTAGITIGTDIQRAMVQNNIVMVHDYPGVVNNGLADATISHNLCDAPGWAFCGTNSIQSGDPAFVSPGGGDFRLQQSSQAKDAGTFVAEVPFTIGNIFLNPAATPINRPQGSGNSIGPFEYEEGGGGVNPTGNPIYLSAGGHGDIPSDGLGDVASCITAENIATPKATLAGACACLSTVSGKKLLVRGGTYPATLDTLNCPLAAGTAAAPTTIEGYLNEPVIFALPVGQQVLVHLRGADDAHLLFKKLTLDAMNRAYSNALQVWGPAHHITFDQVVMRNGTVSCVYMNGVANITFRGGELHDCGIDGLTTGGTNTNLRLEEQLMVQNVAEQALNFGGTVNNTFMDRIRVRNAGTAGGVFAVTIGPGAGTVLQNSLIFDSRAGVRVLTGASNVRIDHNTVTNNTNVSNTAVGLQCDAGAGPNIKFRNNIVSLNDVNVVNNCLIAGSNNFTADPLFANAALDDYTLLPTSTAINSVPTLPEVTTSYGGEPRPQGIASDAGAYERDAPLAPPDPLTQRRVRINAQSFFR